MINLGNVLVYATDFPVSMIVQIDYINARKNQAKNALHESVMLLNWLAMLSRVLTFIS